MNESERTTQFQGFAGLLYPELAKLFVSWMLIKDNAEITREIKTLLAQRGYDFAMHIAGSDAVQNRLNRWDLVDIDAEDILPDIPDLTEWPKNLLQEP